MTSRLSHLLSEGGFALPEQGRIALWCPRAGEDFAPLSREQVEIITGFRPDYDWFSSQSFDCATEASGRYAASLVCLPRERDAARHVVAQAIAATDGPVIVEGSKTDGIESFYKTCRKMGPVSPAASKSHGKIFWFDQLPGAEEWLAQPQEIAPGFVTRPGVFSADGIDPGSHMIAQSLPPRLGAHVVDLGAGWGYLAAQALGLNALIQRLDLVEANHDALSCARSNVSDPRAVFHWADATTWRPETAVDTVIMNPPFHTGRDADPKLGQSFIAAAALMLKPSGSLWMVANRHLPYETCLSEMFREVRESAGDTRFKVLHASRPARPRS